MTSCFLCQLGICDWIGGIVVDDYDVSITRWFQELKQGNSDAPHQLWNAYFDALVRLARKRLGDLPRRELDEEDVAVSVFHCLCDGAIKGRLDQHHDRTDLWKLLSVITRQKVTDHIRRSTAAKRGGGAVRGESVFGIDFNGELSPRGIEQIVHEAPTPELLVALAEQHQRLLDLLGDDGLRQVALLRMEGLSNDEIADQLNISTRSVERKLQMIRQRWSREVNEQ